MKMKSERPLLVDGVPQTEFETSDQHGKELIAKGLAVEVDAKLTKATEPATPAAPVQVDPAPPAPQAPAKAGKAKNT